jgi:short-subunit dehydrogenase
MDRLPVLGFAHGMNNTPKSIAVFGAGPGVGRAVARRYGKAGYDVVLVARRQGPLDQFAGELAARDINAHVVTADLSETGLVPALAERIRAKVGDPTAVYYGPAPADPEFTDAVDLCPERLRELMPLTLYTLLALVKEFLPAMIERGDGAILSAQGAAAVQGLPHMSGWPPVLAAQRNYLQSLAAEVAGQGVYVGMLYIGAHHGNRLRGEVPGGAGRGAAGARHARRRPGRAGRTALDHAHRPETAGNGRPGESSRRLTNQYRGATQKRATVADSPARASAALEQMLTRCSCTHGNVQIGAETTQ